MSFLRTAGNSQVVTPQYTGIQMQASSSALPVPIVWGMTMLAPNVVWAGDFLAVPLSSGSSGGKGGLTGGGGQTTSYNYFTALVFGLCEGPIGTVRWGFDGQSVYSLYQLNLNIIKGTSPQAPWSYLSANHPKKAIAYPGTALLVSPSYDLGAGASVGTLSFEVVGALSGTSVTNTDADPAQIIGDFLTNAQYGVGFPAASIDATTLYGGSGGSSYQAYCAAVGIGLSPALTDQEAANSILARWLQLTNSTAVWSGGKLKFIPYGDTAATGALDGPSGAGTGASVAFVPNTTPVYDLSDDDFIVGTDADPVIVTRSDPYSASNVVNLEVLSRSPTTPAGAVDSIPNYYAPTPVQARDQNAIELYGLRIGSTVTAHEICTVGIGQIVAQLILQRGLYIRNTYAFTLSWECCLLEPMDIVTLSDANLGLARTPVRILEIQEGSDGLLAVTAEEYPGAVGATPGYAVDASTNDGAVTRSVAPAAINAPILFEPPSELTGGVEQIRFGVSGGLNGGRRFQLGRRGDLRLHRQFDLSADRLGLDAEPHGHAHRRARRAAGVRVGHAAGELRRERGIARRLVDADAGARRQRDRQLHDSDADRHQRVQPRRPGAKALRAEWHGACGRRAGADPRCHGLRLCAAARAGRDGSVVQARQLQRLRVDATGSLDLHGLFLQAARLGPVRRGEPGDRRRHIFRRGPRLRGDHHQRRRRARVGSRTRARSTWGWPRRPRSRSRCSPAAPARPRRAARGRASARRRAGRTATSPASAGSRRR